MVSASIQVGSAYTTLAMFPDHVGGAGNEVNATYGAGIISVSTY